MKSLILIFIVYLLSGCTALTTSVQELRDPRATQVCGILNGSARMGDGSAEYCKFHCSDTLPDNFVYIYNDQRGCHFEARGKNTSSEAIIK